MENWNQNRNKPHSWEAGGDDLSKNATNQRDDEQRESDSHRGDDRANQSSAGQQYGNFHQNFSGEHSNNSRSKMRWENNYRGANQFGLNNRGHKQSFQPGSQYYRSDNYGRMNEELNRYDQPFGERQNYMDRFRTQQYDYGESKQYGSYGKEPEGYYGRNSSDYKNDSYSHHYYYRPNKDHLRSDDESAPQGKLSNYYGRSHGDYFDQRGGYNERGTHDYYGSYPSYNQSGADDRDWEDEHPNTRDRRPW